MYWSVAKEIFLEIFLFLLWQSCCSAKLTILVNFGRRHHEEHFYLVILNLDQRFRRRGHLKIYFTYSSGGFFVQCFQTICAIMIVGIMPNISVG